MTTSSTPTIAKAVLTDVPLPDKTVSHTATESSSLATVTVIEPKTGWRLVDWKELVDYRDLFFFLVWRSVKVRYAQSAIGVGWAVIQPLFSMVVFTIVLRQTGENRIRWRPLRRVQFRCTCPLDLFCQCAD